MVRGIAQSLDELPEVLTVEEAAAVLRIGRGAAYVVFGGPHDSSPFTSVSCSTTVILRSMRSTYSGRPPASSTT